MERDGVVSPDGRWIAYHSDEAGRMELFVQSFPVPGAKYQVSSGGVTNLNDALDARRQGADVRGRGRIHRHVGRGDDGASFHAGEPRALFKLRSDVVGVDFSPDGERILAAVPAGRLQSPSITIEMNWPALLRSQAPLQN